MNVSTALRHLSLVTATFWSASVGGAESDPAAAGYGLVEQYCSGCHAIEATGESPLSIAPPFRELHERYDVEFLAEALVEGIATAHPEMPLFQFEPEEAAAIVAYLKSLEPGQMD